MKHKKNVLLITVVTVALLSACETPRYAYSPSAHNVPVLAKQFDSKVSASYSANMDVSDSYDDNNNRYSRNHSNGYDLQGAFAVTNHFALQGSYFSRGEKTNSDGYYGDSAVVRYKRNMFELGAGYFTSINKNDRIYFQVFAGAGFGKLKLRETGRDMNFVSYARFYNTNLTKYYIEPAIIFRNKETFAASLSTRFSVLRFNEINTDYTQPEKEQYNLDSLNRYSTVFLEPAFVNSFGFNKLPGFRIEYQLGFALPLAIDSEPFFDFRPFNFSVGMVFDIGKLIKGAPKED